LLKIKNLTCRNFLSIGNVTQSIKFDSEELTLILGENLDMGGDDSGNRNGVGKTSMVQALCYALYGQAVNSIRKDNLINLTNNKNMLVTLDFNLNGKEYRIERGRKPAILRFFINDIEQKVDEDEAQGDSRETQHNITKLLGMSSDMFRHIVALNTYTEPFLSLKANDQREIIEQLLGITLLSEKDDKLKELIRTTKDMISEEEHRINAVTNANQKIADQISSIIMKQRAWTKQRKTDIADISYSLDAMNEVNITTEIENHKILSEIQTKQKDLKRINDSIDRVKNEILKDHKNIAKAENQLEMLLEHKCHACGQDIHDEKHETMVKENENHLFDLGNILSNHERELLEFEIRKSTIVVPENIPSAFYDNIEDAYNHKSRVETLEREMKLKETQVDPYEDTIIEMKSIGLETIEYEYLNELVSLRDHQEFLLKLLTNKDSFIRKKIIDQNLNYLNARLGYYLEKIGLPHTVVFQNDLTVLITELGRELDFDNLSRGERNRLILSLSFAFRDVWEGLYHPINLLFVDECLDNGTDPAGVENGLGILKHMTRERNKSVWLVSHRDELITRVGNIMKVIKENGFSRFESAVEE
jgi:DNA repair exonuclease SbcCD ATPase subunit